MGFHGLVVGIDGVYMAIKTIPDCNYPAPTDSRLREEAIASANGTLAAVFGSFSGGPGKFRFIPQADVHNNIFWTR